MKDWAEKKQDAELKYVLSFKAVFQKRGPENMKLLSRYMRLPRGTRERHSFLAEKLATEVGL